MSIDYVALATTTMGVTVSLAWNSAANKFTRYLFPYGDGVIASMIYAGTVTALVILMALMFNQMQPIMGASHSSDPVPEPALGEGVSAFVPKPIVSLVR